jgi:hypothetical protein
MICRRRLTKTCCGKDGVLQLVRSCLPQVFEVEMVFTVRCVLLGSIIRRFVLADRQHVVDDGRPSLVVVSTRYRACSDGFRGMVWWESGVPVSTRAEGALLHAGRRQALARA